MLIERGKSGGFTLLEVLVAALVLAIGLLGMSALMLSSLVFNHGASLRGQAVVSAYDMIDRLRANRAAAEDNAYDIAMADDAPSESSASTSIVQFDLRAWLTELDIRLPQGDGSVACVVDLCTVSIQWIDKKGADISGETDQRNIRIQARL